MLLPVLLLPFYLAAQPQGMVIRGSVTDLFSGDLIRTISLYYPFPEKLRINNGFVYFMYKPESDWTRKRLYRQRIY